MKTGYLYFIIDEFYQKFDQNGTLMKNKETVNGISHDRPCFFALRDNENEEIFWLVPISSKVEKYKEIVEHKIEKMESQNKNKTECNTIRFGKVMGNESVFLIQNMFPVTEKYVKNTYIDRNTHNEVTLSPDVTNDIIKNAKQVLKLHSRGIKLTYGNIDNIYLSLKEELIEDRKKNNSNPNAEKENPTSDNDNIKEQLEHCKKVINRTNAILNEHPELKRQFIEAKKEYEQKHVANDKAQAVSSENTPKQNPKDKHTKH